MNDFIFPVIINDRREITLSLSQTPSQKPLKRFVIEVPPSGGIHLLSILENSVLKSLVHGQGDYYVADLTPDFHFSDQELQISLQTKPKVVESVSEPVVEEAEEDKPFTYEELEDFQPTVKVEENPTQNENDHKITTKGLGLLNDTVAISARTYSSGAVELDGDISGDINSLLAPNFPDLKVQIVFIDGTTTYVTQFSLSFAHPARFLGLTLDFGSESSQLAVKRYQRKIGGTFVEELPEPENLFSDILYYHKRIGWIPAQDHSEYYQEEKNTNFYKSIFFLKSELDGFGKANTEGDFIPSPRENLRMLVSSSNTEDGFVYLTQKKFHQLPNLKITHKYVSDIQGLDFYIVGQNGIPLPKPLKKLKDQIYNSILRVMIASFLKKEFDEYPEEQRKIQFSILVPNIYDYWDVKSTQILVENIFKSFAEEEYKGRLLAWEVLTISESDAAFLGYIKRNDVRIQPDSSYIIVDAGKGTTDFSIIRTGVNNPYNIKPTYRNGFAGGGNLITYAVFETLLHHIRANAPTQNQAFSFIREQILKNLTNANLEIKNQFYNELERLKFNYSDQTDYVKQQWLQAKSGDYDFRTLTTEGGNIQTLIDLLRQIENITDFYGYIQADCDLIARLVSVNLKIVKKNQPHFNAGGIILSGRSFMFRPLKDKVIETLSKQLNIGTDMIHVLDDEDLKGVSVKGVFNKSARLNVEKIGYPIYIIPKAPTHATPKLPPVPEEQPKKKFDFLNWLTRSFLNEFQEIETARVVLTPDAKLAIKDTLESQIMIGAKRYKISGSGFMDHEQPRTEVDILFTPNGYLARQMVDGKMIKTEALTPIPDESNKDKKLVLPSLFPNNFDEKLIYSLKRTDITHSGPIFPPPPPSSEPGSSGPKMF